MKYNFITENKPIFSIKRMCLILDLLPASYHAYIRRGISNREIEDENIYLTLKEIRNEKYKRHSGSPLLTKELAKRGRRHSQKRIARIMRENKLYGGRKKKHKYKKTPTIEIQKAENKLDRKFSPEKPNMVWCGDITYIRLMTGWVYLCIVMDLFSKMVVGWALSKNPDSELTVKALNDAYEQRTPGGGIMFHSDRGCQYTSDEFIQVLKEHQINQSLSRKGNCWDNACVESFFGHLKLEGIQKKEYRNIGELMAELTEYIEIYYNRNRLHSSNGYLTPEEKEKNYA